MPEVLFMVFLSDSKGAKVAQMTLARSAFHGFQIQKVQKRVNLVDLVKSFQTSIYYLLVLVKFGVDTAENQPASRERASQSLPKISQI